MRSSERDPFDIYTVLWPAPRFAATPACANLRAPLFPDLDHQRAVFDGEAPDPARDYPRAAAVCRTCPVFGACRRFADSGVPHVFLAGETAPDRDRRRGRAGRIALRRRHVAALAGWGLSAPSIAEILEVDASTVRADLAWLRGGAA
jgi:hypothetical protein